MKLGLYSWNINGLRANLKSGKLKEFLELEDPDVLCLQETRLSKDIGHPEELKDYFGYWNTASRPGYSGTAIISKAPALQAINGFLPAVQKKYHQLLIDKYGDTTAEGRLISVEFQDFWVISVYTPNSKNDLSRIPLRHLGWDKAFKEHIETLAKTKPLFVAGDLNVAHKEIDLARPKENKGRHGFTLEEREGFDELLKNGFIDTFRSIYPHKEGVYTWWSHYSKARERNVGWRIDYWLASQAAAPYVTGAGIHGDILGSDHCPVSVQVEGLKV